MEEVKKLRGYVIETSSGNYLSHLYCNDFISDNNIDNAILFDNPNVALLVEQYLQRQFQSTFFKTIKITEIFERIISVE